MSSLTTGPFQNLSATWAQLMQLTPQQMADASAPDYLKIAAMNAQDNIRQQGQPAAGPAAPPVAQQVVDKAVGAPPAGQAMPASPAPTQMASHGGYIHDYGVASLPYEAHYGHGGIVSFEGGGEARLEESARMGKNYNRDTGSSAAAFSKFAQENPAQAKAIGIAVGTLGAAAVTAALATGVPEILGLTVVGARFLAPIITKLGVKGVAKVLAGTGIGVTGGYLGYSAADTASTPLPTKTPPGSPQMAFTNPDALGMANPDPVDFPAEEPAAADYMPGAPPVYGPGPGGLPSIGNYPEFEKANLPPEYNPEVEDAKQAKANERFGVSKNFYEQEQAKNDAKLSALEAQRKGVYSGQGLMDFGAAMASGESSNFLDNFAKAVPAYTGAVKSGNEYARNRQDLLDTHADLLRGQEQERNVNRANAAFADQNKREAEILAAKNAEITRKQDYGVKRFGDMVDHQYKTNSLTAQFAQITESARQFGISSVQAAQKIEAEKELALATLKQAHADKEALAAATLAAQKATNATTMTKAFSTEYVKLMVGDSAKYPPEKLQEYIDARMAGYNDTVNPVATITTDNDSTRGIGALRPGARGISAGSQNLYTPPSSLRNP